MRDHSTDIQLVDRILSGDSSAYRFLIHRHKEYAFTVAYRILGNREDAEEVAQDAFIQAFRSLASFNRDAKFTTWFYRIVFNAALGRKRKRTLATDSVDDVHSAKLGVAGADDEARRREQQYYIQQAMTRLPPDDVTMITLFYLNEFSLDEIEEITGIAANTAKVKIHRARKRLAEELSKMLKKETHSLL